MYDQGPPAYHSVGSIHIDAQLDESNMKSRVEWEGGNVWPHCIGHSVGYRRGFEDKVKCH